MGNVRWNAYYNLVIADILSHRNTTAIRQKPLAHLFTVCKPSSKDVDYIYSKTQPNFTTTHLEVKMIKLEQKMIKPYKKKRGIHCHRIPFSIFSKHIFLTHIDISDNYINYLPVDLFSGLLKLHSLNLSCNQIKHIPLGIFDKLTELSNLNLYNNYIRELHPYIFKNNFNLQILNIDKNYILHLPLEIFDGLKELKTLNMNWGLASLDPLFFKDLDKLEILEVYRLIFTKDYLETIIDQFIILDKKLMSKNKEFHYDVWRGLVNMKKIKNLTIHRVKFDDSITTLLDCFISKFTNLKILKFTKDNHADTINTIGLPNLDSLILSNNTSIRFLSNHSFNSLTNLTNMDLSCNKIEIIHDHVFKGLFNLIHLNLEDNNFRILPIRVFQDLINLQSLNLSKNKLSDIPVGLLTEFKYLINLDISKNIIQNLSHQSFVDLIRLETLNLSFNKLKKISYLALKGLSTLIKLNIYQTHGVINLAQSVFKLVPRLQIIYLQPNQATMGLLKTYSFHKVYTKPRHHSPAFSSFLPGDDIYTNINRPTSGKYIKS